MLVPDPEVRPSAVDVATRLEMIRGTRRTPAELLKRRSQPIMGLTKTPVAQPELDVLTPTTSPEIVTVVAAARDRRRSLGRLLLALGVLIALGVDVVLWANAQERQQTPEPAAAVHIVPIIEPAPADEEPAEIVVAGEPAEAMFEADEDDAPIVDVFELDGAVEPD